MERAFVLPPYMLLIVLLIQNKADVYATKVHISRCRFAAKLAVFSWKLLLFIAMTVEDLFVVFDAETLPLRHKIKIQRLHLNKSKARTNNISNIYKNVSYS